MACITRAPVFTHRKSRVFGQQVFSQLSPYNSCGNFIRSLGLEFFKAHLLFSLKASVRNRSWDTVSLINIYIFHNYKLIIFHSDTWKSTLRSEDLHNPMAALVGFLRVQCPEIHGFLLTGMCQLKALALFTVGNYVF